jgi:hypothetical protein
MLTGKLRNMLKWVGEEKTVEAIIIEVHGITTAPATPTTLTTSNKPLREPCSYLLVTSEEVIRTVKHERGTKYPLPPPRSLPNPGDKLYNARIILNCFWSIPRSEELIRSVRDLLGELDNALRPREVFAKIIYTDGSVEYVSL